MGNVFFYPWVGQNYDLGLSGVRVMVVGTSHHCDKKNEDCFDCKDQCPGMKNCTIEVIKDEIIPNISSVNYMKTFICFERAIYNRCLDQDERELFWQSLIFYNFCQEPVGDWQEKPNRKMVLDSIPAFMDMLETYKPNCLIFWGKVVAEYILCENSPIDGLTKVSSYKIDEKNQGDFWSLNLNQENILVCQIRHPSVGFSWTKWHDYLNQALTLSFKMKTL